MRPKTVSSQSVFQPLLLMSQFHSNNLSIALGQVFTVAQPLSVKLIFHFFQILILLASPSWGLTSQPLTPFYFDSRPLFSSYQRFFSGTSYKSKFDNLISDPLDEGSRSPSRRTSTSSASTTPPPWSSTARSGWCAFSRKIRISKHSVSAWTLWPGRRSLRVCIFLRRGSFRTRCSSTSFRSICGRSGFPTHSGRSAPSGNPSSRPRRTSSTRSSRSSCNEGCIARIGSESYRSRPSIRCRRRLRRGRRLTRRSRGRSGLRRRTRRTKRRWRTRSRATRRTWCSTRTARSSLVI